MHLVYPVLDCIVDMLINAVECEASMYQAMSLALTCVSEMWECIPQGLYKVTVLLQDIISVSTKPLSMSIKVISHTLFDASDMTNLNECSFAF